MFAFRYALTGTTNSVDRRGFSFRKGGSPGCYLALRVLVNNLFSSLENMQRIFSPSKLRVPCVRVIATKNLEENKTTTAYTGGIAHILIQNTTQRRESASLGLAVEPTFGGWTQKLIRWCCRTRPRWRWSPWRAATWRRSSCPPAHRTSPSAK
jgi:hypothetical protein